MSKQRVAWVIFLSGMILLFMMGCGVVSLITPKSTEITVPTVTDTATYTNTPPLTPTGTLPPSETPTPTITPSQTPPSTPTFTPSQTATPAVTPTTPLGIGSTLVAEKDGMVLVYVPEGEFLMGSTEEQYQKAVELCFHNGRGTDSDCERFLVNEKPQHTVWLDAFWIDQTEVTNAQYQKCRKAGVCTDLISASTISDNYPVVFVGWNQANTYCKWAGRRLPSEAEWEKAARGTDGRIYPWGNQAPTCTLANYGDCRGIWEVGSHPEGASPYGALDMAGNVWEYVNDWYQSNYYQNSPDRNPTGPSSGEYRVMRGGSFHDDGIYVRTSARFWNLSAEFGYTLYGFRCATSP